MPPTPAPSPRRRRLFAAVAVAVSVVAVPLTTGAPAGAAIAPLVTTEGIGIRIDENAILGPVLEDLANGLEPFVEERVIDGALTHTGIANPDQIDATFDIDLGFDFVNAGTAGYPQGGLSLSADIDDLRIRTYFYGTWWWPTCVLYADVSPLAVDASSWVDTAAPTAAPFTALPTTSTWPSATVTEYVAPGYPSTCNSHLTAPFDWAGFSDLTDPNSPASVFQTEVEIQLFDLASNRLWFENIEPLMSSLTTLAGFGVSYNQIRTDADGLVVTADVDATAGVTVDGWGPYPVTGAQDAGLTPNPDAVDNLLARRSLGTVATDVIVSLHPNVTNQYLSAVHDHFAGSYSWTPATTALATALVDPTLGTCYSPTDWGTYLEGQAAPYVTPTGIGGSPRMRFPLTTVQFYNFGGCPFSYDPVATFTGNMYDLPVTPTGVPLSPQGSAPATGWTGWTAARTQADTATAARVPSATTTTLRPWARDALNAFLASVPGYIEMTPGAFPGRTAVLCTTCGRAPSDQRITEGFQIT